MKAPIDERARAIAEEQARIDRQVRREHWYVGQWFVDMAEAIRLRTTSATLGSDLKIRFDDPSGPTITGCEPDDE